MIDWKIVEAVSIVIILLGTGLNLGLTIQLIRNLQPDNIRWTHMVVRGIDGDGTYPVETVENPPASPGSPGNPLPGHPALPRAVLQRLLLPTRHLRPNHR